MAIDKEQFAADIYVRLCELYPSKTEEWRREDAFRQADEFIKHVESKRPKKSSRKT